MENLTPKQKLKLEETATDIAYKVGEFYLYVQSCEEGYDYTLYDNNYKVVDGGVYDDRNITLSEAIQYITEDFIVVGMGSVQDRTAQLVDVTELLDKADAEGEEGIASQKIINAFMDNPQSCFAIYQLKDNDNTEDFRFEGSDYLAKNNIEIDNQNFNAIYTDTLSDKLKSFPHSAVCEQLYAKFNMDIPPDFEGHSLSIGDVIGLNVDGNISYHFVDRFGFKEVPFINPYPVAIGRD